MHRAGLSTAGPRRKRKRISGSTFHPYDSDAPSTSARSQSFYSQTTLATKVSLTTKKLKEQISADRQETAERQALQHTGPSLHAASPSNLQTQALLFGHGLISSAGGEIEDAMEFEQGLAVNNVDPLPEHSDSESEQEDDWTDMEEAAPRVSTPAHPPRRHRRRDLRLRKDRLLRRNDLFNKVIDSMATSLLMYQASRSNWKFEDREQMEGETLPVDVMDIFDTSPRCFAAFRETPGGRALTTGCCAVRAGVIPCAPRDVKFGFSVGLIELYRVLSCECPRLTLEPFLKALCILQNRPYYTYLAERFRIALDLHIQLEQVLNQRVNKKLGRDGDDWRRQHFCPACTATVKGEKQLAWKILIAMDGNESLKCVDRRALRSLEDGSFARIGPSVERADLRQADRSYFISPETVNQYGPHHEPPLSSEHDLSPGDSASDYIRPCDDSWKNLGSSTSKAWAQYEATGTFNAYCRHGFLFVVMDMIRSGELTKYPLAVADLVMDTFGEDCALGYDVGCGFDTRKDKHPIVGPKARRLRLHCCVGSFHGHAHNRICQLRFLASYLRAAGLEDFEICERMFSVTNHAARAVRYQSRFHRHQTLTHLYTHEDFYTAYSNLSKFLTDNYLQALRIEATLPKVDQLTKCLNDGQRIPYRQYLQEELEFLVQTKAKVLPESDELKMQYVMHLEALDAAEIAFQEAKKAWSSVGASADKQTTKAARLDYQAKDQQVTKALSAVLADERKLEIPASERWRVTSPHYRRARQQAAEREYIRALSELESLVVSRMQELTKMNMSDTGYKQRQKIGAALRKRSTAVQNSLKRVNAAGKALDPPRQELEFSQVVDYAFLSEFDFLRASQSGAVRKPWASPLARRAIDKYCKIEAAGAEIERLNVEILRLVTHMRDEESILQAAERSALEDDHDPLLAFAISQRSRRLLPVNRIHRERLAKLGRVPGFRGVLQPGERTEALPAFLSPHTEQCTEQSMDVVTPSPLSYPSEAETSHITFSSEEPAPDMVEKENAELLAYTSTLECLEVLALDDS